MANLKNDPAVKELLAAAHSKGFTAGAKASLKAAQAESQLIVDALPADAKALKKQLKTSHAALFTAIKATSPSA